MKVDKFLAVVEAFEKRARLCWSLLADEHFRHQYDKLRADFKRCVLKQSPKRKDDELDPSLKMEAEAHAIFVEFCQLLTRQDETAGYWEISGLPSCEGDRHEAANNGTADSFFQESGEYYGWFTCEKCSRPYVMHVPNICCQ
ncbi:MAG TPA: hypothetical protein P5328_02100 [Candidatus Paceibacterota bacterium]|nr:hypothetical protein [Candidatus Paceibacterota bacterium]HRZ34456.1 hypothetical protein [Candidatus Paceibacterota bacterium]